MRHLALVLVVLTPLAAASQTMRPDAAPAAGTLRPTVGDEASALTVPLRAEADSGVDGCVGFVAPAAPDAVVEWGGGDLRIWGRAAFDATLLVARPDGAWACNDDAEGTAPAVEIEGAPAGRYAVWLGAFSRDPAETAAMLYAGTPPPPPVLGTDASPRAGVLDVRGGFEDAQGLLEVSVDAGGVDAAAAVDLSGGDVDGLCTGYLDAARPTAGVSFTDAAAGTGLLAIEALSPDDDLVLLVQAPDGSTYCNDDDGGPDPRVVVEDPADGLYLVWVGTFGAPIGTVPATLVIAETAPDAEAFIEEPFQAAPFSDGAYTPLDLSLAPRYTLTLRPSDASQETAATVQPTLVNPVRGDLCYGYIESAPTAGIRLEGEGPVALTATSETDLVLLVQTPDGGWFCSDDADGLNPGVQIDEPASGLYKVWAGSYADGGDPAAVVVAATRGELVVSTPMAEPLTPDVEPQSEGAYDGTAIRPEGASTTIESLPATVVVEAGGPVLNPVAGPACAGFVGERPTAALTAGGDLTIEAEADDDTDLTLVVRTADGAWFCSDDARGTAPTVRITGAPAGVHAIWVGTFSRRSAPPQATLTVTAPPPPPPTPRD